MGPTRRVFSLLIFFLGFAGGLPVSAAPAASQFFLEVDIAIARGGQAGVIFDFGDGIWGENGTTVNVAPGSTPQPVRFPLPARPIRELRFDPASDDSEAVITGMRVVDGQGTALVRLDPRKLRPLHQIRAIIPEGGGVRVQPVANADDPMVRIDLAPLQRALHDASGRETVSRGVVICLGVLVGVLVLLAVFEVWRAHGKGGIAWGAAAIFCVVCGARLAWLNQFSRSLPFWDEWDGDVSYILMPYVGGFLDWSALVMPQWEHRVLLTRTITLFGTALNGEWDPRVAMAVSAAMYAAAVAVIGATLLATRRWFATIIAIGLTAAAALPFDFNNLLWGGQTQMYGLGLLAVCTIGLAAAPTIGRRVWIAAAAGSAVSLFTMGAGVVGPACALGICLVRAAYEASQRRALLGLAAIFLAAVIAGLCLHVSSRAHVPFYATTFAQFLKAWVGVMAWPLPPRMMCVLLVWVPWVVNGVLVLRRRGATTLEWVAVGLGGWGLVNAIALGYARQYEGPPFDSRFFTSFWLSGMLGTILASVALALRAPRWKLGVWPIAVVSVSLAGSIALGVKGVSGARANFLDRADMDTRIRAFLVTGERAPVREKPPCYAPKADDVMGYFESPLFQKIMPAPYRRLLAERGQEKTTVPTEAGPITLTVRTLMKLGSAIAALGVVGLGLFVWRVRPTPAIRVAPELPAPSTLSRPGPPIDWWDRACYGAVIAITLGWVIVYDSIRQDGLCDEPGHWSNIHHFRDQRAGWPEAMPMLPGYHFAVLSVWRMLPTLTAFTVARWVTALIALVGFAAFALTWRRLHGKPAGRATLLLALLPLTQPFTGMVYTDMPALALCFCALWAQVAGHRWLAVLALAEATAFRQTSLIWGGLFVAWEYLRVDEPRRTFLRRIGGLAALGVTAAAIVLIAGRLTVGTQHGNEFRLNPAALHFAGVLLLVLGAPQWVVKLPEAWRWLRTLARYAPAKATAVVVCAAGAATVFAVTFANPHIWNRELWWPECSFTLLRNWPLVWIDSHLWLKVASGVTLVLMLVALARVFQAQRLRCELWIVLALGAIPVLTNGLVEPRYFIPAAGFMLVFLDLDDGTWRRIAVWWALLCVLHAPFVAKALSLW